MPEFYALTGPGCVQQCENELREMGLDTRNQQGGVYFEGGWNAAYRANLRSRTASRIIHILGRFKARTGEELYAEIRKFDWTQWIDADQYIFVEASTRESEMRDQRFIAMKVKDAIVDQFRDKFGIRPSVDSDDAELQIWIRFYNNEALLGINTSGDPLFKRGYRVTQHEAPIKEHIAASLLKMTGWDAKTPLMDPMCGSGTFLIEGALMALNISPGTLRSQFSFQRWHNFDKAAWETEVAAAMEPEIEDPGFKFYGFDLDREAVHNTQKNVKAAGLEDLIQISKEGVSLFEPPAEKGLIIVNPPYGERLEGDDEELLKDVYRDLGFALKSRFKGWTAWVLTPKLELANILGMKPAAKFEVWNGPIPCMFFRYDIFR
jgi:23S rRNA (guanine2445-N2)-methyltransferase / 23S rRNA (guanine2069-N7)-methyltransferase